MLSLRFPRNGAVRSFASETGINVPEALWRDENRHALMFAVPRSAHGDIGAPLLESVRHLPNAEIYCADWASFRSVIVHAGGVVFAFAEGMQGVSVRLPRSMAAEALERGAVSRGDLGEGWMLLPLFTNDCRFMHELPTLVGAAYGAVEASRKPPQPSSDGGLGEQ